MSFQPRASRRSATGAAAKSSAPNDEDAMSQPVRSSRRAVTTAGPMANGSSAANVAPASGSHSPQDTAKVKREKAAAAARQARRDAANNVRNASINGRGAGAGTLEIDEEDDEDDEDAEHGGAPNGADMSEGEDEAETSTAHARKRKRVGGDEDDEDDDAEEGEGDGDEGDSRGARGRLSGPVQLMKGVVAKRAEDGFLPGAIVRVKLANFVTYDAVEFRPGPYLNMIIGPNGTGKSTVVCAIALGLGWKPGVLGRAKDVAAYVKQGHQSGSIEIELKAKAGQRNPVIKRVIFKKSNKSEWSLNGRSATLTEINDLVTNLDIQIGNLCSFLPQDKVADFAAMQPPDLLKETQKAAGDGKLTHWHNQLIKLGAEHRELMAKLNSDEEEVANLQQRNEVLQRDVRRYEERRRIELAVQVLQLQILFAHYNVVKLKYDESKKVRNQRKDELRRLQQKHEPLTSLLTELEDEEKDVERERKKLTRDTERRVSDLRSKEKEYLQLEQKYEDEVEKRDTVEQREKERKSLIASLRKAIETLEERVADAPSHTSTEAIDQRVRELRQQQRQLQNEADDVENTLEEHHQQMTTFHQQKTETLNRLAALDNVKAARFKMLAQADKDTAEAVRWLRENPGLFQKKVYEPVMLETSITDPRHAAAVESCINWNHMRTFVCQTRADYDLFTAEVIDKKRLRVNVSENEGARSWNELARPLAMDQLRQLGFDHYIIDLVDAPEPILTFLCQAANLHTIPVAFDDRSVDIEQVESRRVFKRYITGRTNHTVTFSSYGRKLPQTLSRALKDARTFSHSVNQQLKGELDARMKAIAAKMSEAERETAKLRQKAEATKTKLNAQKEAVEEAQRERREMQRPLQEWERAKATLQSKRTALAKEEAQPSAAAQSNQIASSIQKLVIKQAKLASEMQALVVEEVRLRGQRDEASLRAVKIQQNLEALKAIITEQSNIYTTAQEALDAAQDDFVACKTAAVKSHNTAQESFDKADTEVMEAFRERGGGADETSDLNELEEKLEAEQAKLHLAHGVSANVIDAFRRREADIKELEAVIAERRRNKSKLDRRIGEVQNKWLPALEALVENVSEKFSQAFDRLGCAGEVRLSKHEDYDKWGIDILVKFRDNEQLQLLSGQRQSGGERSLSTILYLMSLTELSRSPFSLVDEINQGMDQRAERAVHDQMVEVTCKEDASQYFLITPKLLPDLRFHERMKVLVINNGEWLPETFNFNRYVARKRKRLDIAAASSGARGTAAAH